MKQTISVVMETRKAVQQLSSGKAPGANAIPAEVMDAFQDSDRPTGFTIRYRFNLKRLQAKTKVQTDLQAELLYADDMDKNASLEAMDQVSQSCDNYDLRNSTKKTEFVHQLTPGKPVNEPNITVNGQTLKVVDKLTFLGSTLSRAVHIDDGVTARIAKASVAFGRLRVNVWERNGIKLDTKLKVYMAIVLPTILYACETWTAYQRHAKRHFLLILFEKAVNNQVAR